MQTLEIEGQTVLRPDEGKWLYNGDVYSVEVWLAIEGDPADWSEVPEEEVPEEFLPTDPVS